MVESKNRQIVALQYSYIFFFCLLLIYYRVEINSLNISLILGYLINHQLRMHSIVGEKEISFLFSLCLESILAYLLFSLFGRCGGILFISVCIELSACYAKWYSILYMALIVLIVGSRGSVELVLFTLIELVPIMIMMQAFKMQSTRKETAQELYDHLREKEIELEQTNKELENYASSIEEIAILRERNRISREIHDNVGHALSTMIIQLSAIQNVTKQSNPEISEMAGELGQFAKVCMEDVRAAVQAMKPKAFEGSEGMVMLYEMIKNFEKLTGIIVKFEVSKNKWQLTSDEAMVTYRIIQEFLSNALKHGKATEVKTFFNFTDNGLRIYLKDNGVGCDHIVAGNGLKGMKERVNLLGGTVEYHSHVQQGFETVISLDKGKLMID